MRRPYEIKALREVCGMSQEQFAARAGYSIRTVQAWESSAESARNMKPFLFEQLKELLTNETGARA